MELLHALGGYVVPFIIVVLAVGFALTVKYAASRYRKVSPGRVGIFYGRDFKWKGGETHGHLLLTSGGRVQRPIIESYLEIPTTAFQVMIDETDIPNQDNVKVTVKGVATCKILDDPNGLNNAVKAILDLLNTTKAGVQGGPAGDLNRFVLNILKGHLRSIIGTLDINGLLRERTKFNQQMVNESKTELQNLGIDLMNLVIQDINDKEGYIDALGRQAVADAKAQAEIKVAQATRDQEISVSNAKREASLVSAENAAAVANAEKDRDVKQAQYKALADTERARAEMAFEIAKAAQEQTLKVAQAERDAAEKQAQIDVQKKEADRRTAELQATVVATAKAQKDKAIIDAEAEKQTKIIDAQAQAEVIQTTAEAKKRGLTLEGEGEAAKQKSILVAQAEGGAAATKQALLAQAEGTSALAKAFQEMNESGKLVIILDRLPVLIEKFGASGALIAEAIFKSVAAPMGQIDKINIIDMGGGNGASGLDKLSSIVPNTVFKFFANMQAQGIDVNGMLNSIGIDMSKAMSMLGMSDAKTTDLPAATENASPVVTATDTKKNRGGDAASAAKA